MSSKTVKFFSCEASSTFRNLTDSLTDFQTLLGILDILCILDILDILEILDIFGILDI